MIRFRSSPEIGQFGSVDHRRPACQHQTGNAGRADGDGLCRRPGRNTRDRHFSWRLHTFPVAADFPSVMLLFPLLFVFRYADDIRSPLSIRSDCSFLQSPPSVAALDQPDIAMSNPSNTETLTVSELGEFFNASRRPLERNFQELALSGECLSINRRSLDFGGPLDSPISSREVCHVVGIRQQPLEYFFVEAEVEERLVSPWRLT